jgi:hypothetical protein
LASPSLFRSEAQTCGRRLCEPQSEGAIAKPAEEGAACFTADGDVPVGIPAEFFSSGIVGLSAGAWIAEGL